MSIIRMKRRKGHVYKVKVWRDGIAYSKTFDGLFEAQQYEREIKLTSDTSGLRYTFDQAAKDWLENHAVIRKASKSVATDKQMLRDNILPIFGGVVLRDATPHLVEILIQKMLGHGRSKSTVNRNLELVRAIFNYAIKRRRAYFNPVTVVGLLRVQQPPIVFWLQDEAQRFLAFTEGKYRGTGREVVPRLYKFALNTGMRLGEVLGQGWPEIDLHNRLITVRRSYDGFERQVKNTTKGHKIRHVPINTAIYGDLLAMRSESESELVFTISGRPFDRSNVSHNFQRDVREAGVRKIRFQDLRHTFASHFMMNGGDIYHLKEILGHSDIKTTMRYVHLLKTFLVDKADIVSFSSDNVVRVDFGKRNYVGGR